MWPARPQARSSRLNTLRLSPRSMCAACRWDGPRGSSWRRRLRVLACAPRAEEAAVAVIMNQTMPEGVPIEMLDGVTREMDVKADPPPGMILHVHYQDGARVHVMDVWE